jgi:cytochrome c-type biogenesis protein CcmH/NrfG
MKEQGVKVDRLLRSAANLPEESPAEAPFGFDTRVVALWRAGHRNGDAAELRRFLRRVGAVAFAVVALASAGVYQQFSDNEQRISPQSNEYAIADSAIQTEFSQ